MKDINNAEDLANVFKSGELINEKAIDDNLELLKEIFKDFKQIAQTQLLTQLSQWYLYQKRKKVG